MTVSYWDIASMAIDGELTMREQAAAAQEDLPDDVDPQTWVAGKDRKSTRLNSSHRP